MNEIINEIFEKYEVRKKRSEKTAFIDYTLKKAEELGVIVGIEPVYTSTIWSPQVMRRMLLEDVSEILS